MDKILNKALAASRESKTVEFKETFDVSSQGEWCEILKDIVAVANSGGGVILIGVDNHGNPRGSNISQFLQLDPADLTNKIHKYSGIQFSDFEIRAETKANNTIGVLRIHSVSIPIVFTKPGTYDIGGGKQKTAFKEGAVYFRHGAKSEPGNSEDIRKVIERQLESIRRDWIRGVRKVVAAPAGSHAVVASGEIRETSSPSAMPIRIVNDPGAPAFRKIDFDVSHPFRMTELIEVLNSKLNGQAALNPHDIYCLRRLHDLDNNPSFCHKPRFTSMQYSEVLVSWILEHFAKDADFLMKSRKECHERRYELKLTVKPKRTRRS